MANRDILKMCENSGFIVKVTRESRSEQLARHWGPLTEESLAPVLFPIPGVIGIGFAKNEKGEAGEEGSHFRCRPVEQRAVGSDCLSGRTKHHVNLMLAGSMGVKVGRRRQMDGPNYCALYRRLEAEPVWLLSYSRVIQKTPESEASEVDSALGDSDSSRCVTAAVSEPARRDEKLTGFASTTVCDEYSYVQWIVSLSVQLLPNIRWAKALSFPPFSVAVIATCIVNGGDNADTLTSCYSDGSEYGNQRCQLATILTRGISLQPAKIKSTTEALVRATRTQEEGRIKRLIANVLDPIHVLERTEALLAVVSDSQASALWLTPVHNPKRPKNCECCKIARQTVRAPEKSVQRRVMHLDGRPGTVEGVGGASVDKYMARRLDDWRGVW
ncbi:hypothetical protein R3P38DRAFT_3364633 [Favolaschia claudopus]|uniref:Uncharacterized protein n=1 Tax=Favolaschia claudopus TaxID=2862362 RepID=A0AAW0AIY1_9AGAR